MLSAKEIMLGLWSNEPPYILSQKSIPVGQQADRKFRVLIAGDKLGICVAFGKMVTLLQISETGKDLKLLSTSELSSAVSIHFTSSQLARQTNNSKYQVCCYCGRLSAFQKYRRVNFFY